MKDFHCFYLIIKTFYVKVHLIRLYKLFVRSYAISVMILTLSCMTTPIGNLALCIMLVYIRKRKWFIDTGGCIV